MSETVITVDPYWPCFTWVEFEDQPFKHMNPFPWQDYRGSDSFINY